jgi:sporulation protein YlmC with PRC-barrel domain
MKVNEELIGKEVVDDSGDQVGVIKDVDINTETKSAEFLVLGEGGISAKIGLGDKTLVPINMVKTIGDKVLIKGKLLQTE